MPDYVLVADCGSTNITVTAVDEAGNLAASASRPNGPVPQEGGEGWLAWDVERLWGAVRDCCGRVVEQVGADAVKAVAVATWGADGTAVAADGTVTYPPIAWECQRTEATARRLGERIGARRLFSITGYPVIRFNTLFVIGWLRENAPEALDGAEKWLLMPGLLTLRLTGRMTMDVTSASTMMLLDLEKGTWSKELLDAVGADESFFPEIAYPGDVLGEVTAEAAAQTGLREGTPVVAAGHDTQFAPIGSGATPQEAVLSTGTWEIAMLRTPEPATGDFAFGHGVLTEVDAVRGLYDPQFLMMGSGCLEWLRERFYGGIEDRAAAYATMIGEARGVKPGAGGVMMAPSFVPAAGPASRYNTGGTILGLQVSTTRAHVYRAALEGLSFQLREALRILGQATGRRPERLRVVGGGSRNELWNRIRADVCRIPVVVTERKEATVVGAAIAGWVGAGRFDSIEQGERELPTESHVVEPGPDAERYEEMFERYRLIAPSLKDFYSPNVPGGLG